MNCTSLLLSTLKGEVARERQEILDCARSNKMLLEILRITGWDEELRLKLEERLGDIVEGVEEVLSSLDGLNFVFFKLIKPLAYVPSDIDVLIDPSDLTEGVRRLEGAGYRVVVKSSFTVTMRRNVQVDLYTMPSVGDLIYLDGRGLLKFRSHETYGGIRVPTLEREVEALVVASHALFKELTLTLNDVVTYHELRGPLTKYLAAESGFGKLFADMERYVEFAFRGELDLPLKIGLRRWAWYLTEKMRDQNTRNTFPKFVRRILRGFMTGEIQSKLFQKYSY